MATQMMKTIEKRRPDRIKFEKDEKGEWRWNRTAPNGKIVGASTEGYKNLLDCIINFQRNLDSNWVTAEIPSFGPK